MSIREKCRRDGHKFRQEGLMLPYVFCARWRCEGAAVSKWAHPSLAVGLHNAIPAENQFPPVELDENGVPT